MAQYNLFCNYYYTASAIMLNRQPIVVHDVLCSDFEYNIEIDELARSRAPSVHC